MTFIAVLWTIGGALDFNVGSLQVHIPGFLVIAAVLYSVIASGAMGAIGRRFVQVSEAKNQTEAEYRYVLTRLRENGRASRSFVARKRNAQASAGRCAK
jgi:putative ATP-binding cassette transporter